MGKIISFIPTCEYYLKLGKTYFDHFQYSPAIKYLTLAQSLAKTNDAYIFITCQLSICQFVMQNYQAAATLLETLSPTNYVTHPEIQYFLATTYAFLDRYEEGTQLVKAYLKSGQTQFAQEAVTLLNRLQVSKPSSR